MADRRANNSMNQMIGQLGDNRQPTQAANKLVSALQRSPSQRPVRRPMQPGVQRQPMAPKQPSQPDFRNLPSQRPMPRPMPSSPGEAAGTIAAQQPMPRPMPGMPGQNVPASPGSKAPDFRGQPVFKPFPRPINAPGQRPDMYAGGTPNFDEMMGQYKPQPLPNVQDAFQQAYQQYNPQPVNQQAGQLAQQQGRFPQGAFQPYGPQQNQQPQGPAPFNPNQPPAPGMQVNYDMTGKPYWGFGKLYS